METVSMLLHEIMNLSWAAHEHKKQCNSPECNISLSTMKNTAIRMRNQLSSEVEQNRATGLIQNWPN